MDYIAEGNEFNLRNLINLTECKEAHVPIDLDPEGKNLQDRITAVTEKVDQKLRASNNYSIDAYEMVKMQIAQKTSSKPSI